MTTFEDSPLHPEGIVLITGRASSDAIIDLVAPSARVSGTIVAPPRRQDGAAANDAGDQEELPRHPRDRASHRRATRGSDGFKRNTDPSVEVIASTFDRFSVVCAGRRDGDRRPDASAICRDPARLIRASPARTTTRCPTRQDHVRRHRLERCSAKKFFARAIETVRSPSSPPCTHRLQGRRGDPEGLKGNRQQRTHLDYASVDSVCPRSTSPPGHAHEALLDPKNSNSCIV